ncbi:MAG: DUF1289 domain-containing protein [Proteobacteria bacterium]|nr:DUF1289 domain-containing protein [Pseudomonadota bacterium]
MTFEADGTRTFYAAVLCIEYNTKLHRQGACAGCGRSKQSRRNWSNTHARD